MSLSIYYSWQKELPPGMTRNIIPTILQNITRKFSVAIKIRCAKRSCALQDANDGNIPNIERIKKCQFFIADLSCVGKTKNGKLVPSSEVLLECGLALGILPTSHIIGMVNTAYGTPDKEDLIFCYIKRPILYNIDSTIDNHLYYQEITSVVRNVKDILESSFPVNPVTRRKSDIADTLPSVSDTKPATFLGKKEAFAKVRTRQTETKTRRIILPSASDTVLPTFLDKKGTFAKIRTGAWSRQVLCVPDTAYLFLRLLQKDGDILFRREEMLSLIRTGNLAPMSDGSIERFSSINTYGAFVCYYEGKDVLHLTQMFRNGQLWGMDADTIRKGKHDLESKLDFGYIPSVEFERTFNVALANYLDFSARILHLSLPLQFVAGVTNVRGYKMMAPPGMRIGYDKFGGEINQENILYKGVIETYQRETNRILKPFFNKVWDACDLYRPNKDYLG